MKVLQSLIWIAKQPQDKSSMAPATSYWIYSAAEAQGLVRLRTVVGHPLLEVCAGKGQLSEGEQGVSQRNMGREEVRGLLAPGQVEAPLHQLAQRL
jgi:hypothetical protein